MLAVVASATLPGSMVGVIRVEVDVAPGPARVHHRRAADTAMPGGPRAGPRSDPQCRLHLPGAADHDQPRPGGPAQGGRLAGPGHGHRPSCSARSRRPAGDRVAGADRGAVARRRGPPRCRASCRWSPPCPGRGIAAGHRRRRTPSTRRGWSTGWTSSASPAWPRRVDIRARPRSRRAPVADAAGDDRAGDGARGTERARCRVRLRRRRSDGPGPRRGPRPGARRGARSRSPWPVATACSCPGRPGSARRSWRGPSRGCCPRSTTRPRWP